MGWKEDISLRPYNTFGIEASARHFARFSDADQLEALLRSGPFAHQGRPASLRRMSPGSLLVLGGGSNILFTRDPEAWVLKNEIAGIRLLREDNRYVYVQVGAGEVWHDFVQHCLKRDWAGVENLSLIPGSVGAAPMQNIGAYGVEIREVFYDLSAYDLTDKKVVRFSLNDCEFGYRESIFKRRLKGRFIILDVTFRLRKVPQFHTEYGAIREELEKMGVGEL